MTELRLENYSLWPLCPEFTLCTRHACGPALITCLLFGLWCDGRGQVHAQHHCALGTALPLQVTLETPLHSPCCGPHSPCHKYRRSRKDHFLQGRGGSPFYHSSFTYKGWQLIAWLPNYSDFTSACNRQHKANAF